jgi:hypothetical protein
MKHFPNGFTSWMETHYEVVQAITIEWTKDEPKGVVKECQETLGHGGLYELAEELTDEFELKYNTEYWSEGLGYFETLENFLSERL